MRRDGLQQHCFWSFIFTNLTELLWELVFWALSHKRKPAKNFKGMPHYSLDRKFNKLHLLLSEETSIYDTKHPFTLIACNLLHNSDRHKVTTKHTHTYIYISKTRHIFKHVSPPSKNLIPYTSTQLSHFFFTNQDKQCNVKKISIHMNN